MSAPREPAAPLISVCIPTHDGRRAELEALLDGALEQARGLAGRVEVCVADNASRDGTREMVARLSSGAVCPIRYVRHDTDHGLAPNLLAAVELATARYCWLMGSDDLLAPAALARACALIERLPGAAGYAVGAVHVDERDPALRSRALARAFHPPGEGPRLIEGLDAIIDECGNSWCALSWSIVDRVRWLRAATARRPDALANPVFPQIVIMAAMAAERPIWGWLSEPLVHQRNATTFLFERSTVSLADRWSTIVGGAAGAWAAVLGGRGRARWRRRMRLLHRVWGSAADVRASKLYERPPLRSQARLAACCLRAYWPVREYWTEVLPASIAPAWLTRARYAPDARLPAGGRHPAAEHIAMSAKLPNELEAGAVCVVSVTLGNRGRRTIRPDGPSAVTLGQRWYSNGDELGAQQLACNALAALPQSLDHPVRASRTVTCALALYIPPAPGVYQLRIAPHQHGRGWLDEADPALRVERRVEVREPRAAAGVPTAA
jgi:hypothetical protein